MTVVIYVRQGIAGSVHQRLLAEGRDLDRVLVAQQLDQDLDVGRDVVDDEDSSHCVMP